MTIFDFLQSKTIPTTLRTAGAILFSIIFLRPAGISNGKSITDGRTQVRKHFVVEVDSFLSKL